MSPINKEKTIHLFVVYSYEDREFFDKIKDYLSQSGISIEITGSREVSSMPVDSSFQPLSLMEKADIILMLISADLLASDYPASREAQYAMELHKKGATRLIPILITKLTLEDTVFENLPKLPSGDRPVTGKEWNTEQEAYKNIVNGIEWILQNREKISQDAFFSQQTHPKPPLPFCIKGFSIKNFQCIRDSSLQNIPVDSSWIFITGENGDGKTALLQALAVGLLDNKDKEANRLLSENTEIEVEYKHCFHNMIRRFTFKKDETGGALGNVDYFPLKNLLGYGVTRLNIMTSEAEAAQADTNPVISLYNETEGNFRNIENWIKDHFLDNQSEETPILQDVKNTLKRLIPNISRVELRGKDIIYHEKGFEASYLQISAGGKMIIAMIGDMIRNFFKAQPYAKKVADFQGVVLIDELDLHLHPKWQKELPGLLSEIFPRIQFWATTHSIVPFLGAPGNSVFLTASRTPEKGTEIKRLDIDIKRLLPNTIISSPLFGIEDFIRGDVNNFRTEYLYSEYEKNKKLDEKLEELAKKFILPKALKKEYDRSKQ